MKTFTLSMFGNSFSSCLDDNYYFHAREMKNKWMISSNNIISNDVDRSTVIKCFYNYLLDIEKINKIDTIFFNCTQKKLEELCNEINKKTILSDLNNNNIFYKSIIEDDFEDISLFDINESDNDSGYESDDESDDELNDESDYESDDESDNE